MTRKYLTPAKTIDDDSGSLAHEWPDASGTAVDPDVVTLADLEARQAAKLARIAVTAGVPDKPRKLPGRPPRPHRRVNGALELRCFRCKAWKAAKGGFYQSLTTDGPFKYQRDCAACQSALRKAKAKGRAA